MITYFKNIDFSKLPDKQSILTTRNRNQIRYQNTANAFDIETSSFHDSKGNKRACMYLFMFCLDGLTFYGRTWAEFRWVLEEIVMRYKLDFYNRMIIYVHNLAYEFQFLINHVSIEETFARTKRHPIKTLIEGGIELRCSYLLSGLSLAKTAEEIPNMNIKKKEGDLDYRLIRHSETPLTTEELEYGEYDVLIVYYFIKNEIKKCDFDITKIPLTKTGYVRNYCREYIQSHTNYKNYRNRIVKWAPTDPALFTILNKAFAGGYTHANCNYIYDVLDDVASIDFASSYPAQMIAHKYPMGKFVRRKLLSEEMFYSLINQYACVFEIHLTDVEALTSHHIWSVSKCKFGVKPEFHAVNDNGRLVKSDEIYTYMTDVDFKNFEKFYKFNIKAVHNMWTCTYSYLPKEIIECVLKFFGDKTTFKGVKRKEDVYLVAKGMLNALYGMCVTNPVNDEIIFDEDWRSVEPDMKEALEKAYNNPKQFLCYQWGVWITAWARYELYRGIIEFNNDVIYCDTDSIKFLNYDIHKEWIDNYNKEVLSNLEKTLNFYGISTDLMYPKNIKDETKYLGIWEYEGKYDKFKTLGAKRYMTETNGKLHMTVSGLNNKYEYEDDYEKECIKNNIPYSHEDWLKKYEYTPTAYILSHGGLDFFTDEMVIPPEYSKRLVHTYIPDYYTMELTDYTGKVSTVEEFCYIHLEPTSFSLSFTHDFIVFLLDIDCDYICERRSKRLELMINEWNMTIDDMVSTPEKE